MLILFEAVVKCNKFLFFYVELLLYSEKHAIIFIELNGSHYHHCSAAEKAKASLLTFYLRIFCSCIIQIFLCYYLVHRLSKLSPLLHLLNQTILLALSPFIQFTQVPLPCYIFYNCSQVSFLLYVIFDVFFWYGRKKASRDSLI